jgi:hypothetical protein
MLYRCVVVDVSINQVICYNIYIVVNVVHSIVDIYVILQSIIIVTLPDMI